MKTLRSLYVNQMYSKNGEKSRVLCEKFINVSVLPDTSLLKCDDRRYINGGLMISGQNMKMKTVIRMINPPVLCSASRVSECEEKLDGAETRTQEIPQSKKLRVKLQLKKECMFGEKFFVVGDDPMFGSWDTEAAIPLDWSEEHLWTVELDIPLEKRIQFKLLLKENTGNMLWQPGPDRVLQTWETDKTITVLEDWENPEMQKIIEEVPVQDKNVNSDILLGEHLTLPNEEKMEDLKNKSPGIVGNNGNATDATKLDTLVNGLFLVNDEDGPVLVPGLTPLQTEEEATVYQNDRSISMDDTVGPDEPEARTGNPLELNERPREENMTILFKGEELFRKELQQNHEVDRVKEQLRSDMKWCCETVQKFLSNLGKVSIDKRKDGDGS